MPETALLRAASDNEGLGASGRRVVTGAVVLAHVLGGWALLQVPAVREAAVSAAPVMVSMLASPEPEPERPKPEAPLPRSPAPKPSPPRAAEPAPPPLVDAAPAPEPPAFVAPPPAPAPVVVVAPVHPVPPTPSPAPPAPAPTAATAPATPAPPAALEPPRPAAPRQIAAEAVRYVAQPRMTVPLISRRLRESGIVVLRIVVDVRGLLKDAVVSRSSGYPRLDEQALKDIRTARFAPQTEDGRPIEWQTTAPLAYEVD